MSVAALDAEPDAALATPPALETLFERADLQILHQPGDRREGWLTVGAFTARGPSCVGLIRRRGVGGVHIVSKSDDWYQGPEIDEAMNVVREALRPCERRIGFGASMGGFGVLAFSGALDLDLVIAGGPQTLVDADVTRGVDDRWRPQWETIADRGLLRADVRPLMTRRGRVKMLLDPMHRQDRWHYRRIADLPNVDLVSFPFSGHELLVDLATLGLYPDLINALVDGGDERVAEIQHEMRASRRERYYYWMFLGRTAWERGRPRMALPLLDKARELSGTEIEADYFLSHVHEALGGLSAAKVHARAAIERAQGPHHAHVYHRMAHLHVVGHEIAAADAVMSEGLMRFPDAAHLHCHKGLFHWHAPGNIDVADHHLRRAFALAPNDHWVRGSLEAWEAARAEMLAPPVRAAKPVLAPVMKAPALPCPVCETPTARAIRGEFAAFLLQRCTFKRGAIARSYLCERCEHVFKTPFLTSEQLAAFYAGYRGPAYDAQRIAVEPGYGVWPPKFADPESDYYGSRRSYYDAHLSGLRSFRGRVVDFGGNDGFWTGHVFPYAHRTVADESYEREGGDLDALMRETDFLFCAHVFEHVPQPYALMSRLVRSLKQGARVWLELPVEYAGSLEDAFEQLEDRQRGGDLSLASPLQWLHEHVSAFSVHSAQMLLSRCGLVVDEVKPAPGIGILAHRPY